MNLEKLIKEKIKLENQIEKKLKKLDHFGEDCPCAGDIGLYPMIVWSHEGEFVELVCCQCGGTYIEINRQ